MDGVESQARSPSLWLDPPPVPGPPLRGTVRTEVAVVGAGYTGLCAALELRRRGVSVAVLERDFAGFGASGRNAGHLTPTIGKDLPSLLRGFGRERGGDLVRLAEQAVEHVEGLIAELGIDCAYRAVGNLVAGVHDGQRRRLERSARAGAELGAAVLMLDRRELARRGLPRSFTCGYLEQRGGLLDPGRYARGLAEAAQRAGAELHESTPVLELDGGPSGHLLRTPRAEVHAERILIATNAYSSELGVPAGAPLPLQVSLLATEPLPLEVREAIGWSGEEGVYTAHEILESHRLTADGRLLSGSRFVRYVGSAGAGAEGDPGDYARIEAIFRHRFPEALEVPVARFWSGPIGFNLNFLPWVDRTRDGRTCWALGFAGHGIAMASLAGTRLAGMALGEDPGMPALTEAKRVPLPPERLREPLARTLIAGLERVDRRTDRRAGAQRGLSSG